MKKVTVLITCVGALDSPSQVGSLRDNPDHRLIRIVGVDGRNDCIGKYICDAFYKVPFGGDKNYAKIILGICEKEKVNVVFPASHEEALPLAKAKKMFENKGIKIAISDYDVLESAFNKITSYEILAKNNLPYPKFFVVKSADEFQAAAKKLGYPKKDIVMKQALGRGGRGVRILTKANPLTIIFDEKPGSIYFNYNNALEGMKALPKFPEVVLTEYLPGMYYSVDFLAMNGEPLIIVPKIRIDGNPSTTLLGLVKKNSLVEKTVANICRVFKFSYNINIEIKFSDDGVPIPYDINPRIAASVAFCSAAGANLIYYGLKLALGEKIPEKVEITEGVKMVRYLKEYYTKEDIKRSTGGARK